MHRDVFTIAVQSALDAVVRDSLRPVSMTLAVLFLFFATTHPLVLAPPAALPMTLLALSTAVIFVIVAIMLYRRRLPTFWAHRVALAVLTMVLLNSFAHLALVGEPLQSTNIALTVIGAGCWLLSLPALAAVLIAVWATWISIALSAWASDPSSAWMHFAFMLVGATAVSLLVHSIRFQTTWRLELLRLHDEHKQAELENALQAFRQSEARFRSLAEASFEGILVHDGERILDANLAVAEMTGYSVAELIGMPPHVLAASDVVTQWRQVDDISTVVTEVVGRRKDGECFPAEVCGKVVPYHGLQARVVAVRDLSERQRADVALRASEERYALAAAGANDGLWDWQLATGVVYYSARWLDMLGLPAVAQDQTLALWLDRVHPDDRAQIETTVATHLDRKTTHFACEHRVRHQDGTYRWMLARGLCVRDRVGQPTRMAGSQTDITEHKQILHDLAAAKAAADTASSAKSAFLATMSHELRTPLTAILGYSEMLEEYAVEKGVVDALPEIQRIHRAGNHLRDLINDVLNLSKVESGKMEIYVEPFLILDVVNDVAATVQPLIGQGGNCLKIEHASKLGLMYSDQTKLRQVLLNLLGNAAKFTSNGTVCLRITRSPNPEDDVVCFEITDTGIGMSQEQIDRLFQPFVQADVSITRRYGGTGLGLALSQRFCQLMGGNVTVTSQEGVGTTFLVQIPAQIRETSAQSASEHILTN